VASRLLTAVQELLACPHRLPPVRDSSAAAALAGASGELRRRRVELSAAIEFREALAGSTARVDGEVDARAIDAAGRQMGMAMRAYVAASRALEELDAKGKG
jgi:hypothetical protein